MQYQANPNYKDFNAYLPFKPETGDSGSSLIGPLSKKPGSFEDMPESAGSDQEGDGSKSPADQPRVGSDETVRDDEQGNIVCTFITYIRERVEDC
jgi:hypothetical protein